MARTSGFLVAPIRQCVAGGQKDGSCYFRRPFLVHFLGEQKMNKINLEEQKNRSEAEFGEAK
jgi:hypothetical protein